MMMIPNSIIANDYLRNCKDTIFTVLLRHALVDHTDSLGKLKNYSYVHGLLNYPKWTPTSDIFQFIRPEFLTQIQNKETFFIFDASTEGFSPIHEFPFFDMLYFNCEKYNVDPSMVFYVSANLRDEENIRNYSAERNLKPIHVFSFLSFEQVLAIDDKRKNHSSEELYQASIDNCKISFNDKFFSSLSRINRPHRTIGSFMLCQSDIEPRGLISHDSVRMPREYIDTWLQNNQLTEYSSKQVIRWVKSLPKTVDREDFKTNWAIDTKYGHIHDSTLFQIVNETLVLDNQKTSLFYSEKTFRPVAYFQPFVIYGQQWCNYSLKELGYKLYDEWFDLTFDSEPDPVLRYKTMLVMLTDTCKMLESLDKEQQIEWRFKNKEILLHNFTNMIHSQYSKDKLFSFLESISNEID